MTPSVNPQESRPDPLWAALSVGAKVGGGRFTLLRQLGQGGMAVVWLARDEHLREDVALKFVPQEIRHDAVALDDLRRETTRSRKLTHPHIIRLHDLYKSDNEAFISMEYVEGANLSELRLQQPDRVFKWSFLEPLVRQLCDALEYAHVEHVIHRDLKPANMLLDSRGRLKLADFGLAATVSDSLSRVSMGNHAFSGTASYMSPQQLDGQIPQVTDDIYSLGSTLYELLTSRAPFFTGDIAHQVRSMPPQPLEKRLAQLRIENPTPPAIGVTIMACLAKEPEKRPQSVRAVAEGMGFTSVREREQKAPEVPAAVTPPIQTQAAQPAAEKTAEPVSPAKTTVTPRAEPEHVSRPRWPALAAAAALVVVSVAGTAWWLAHRDRSDQVTQAAPTNQLTQPSLTNVATQIVSLPGATQTPAAKLPTAEFVSLFNGRDLSEWDGNATVWSVKDGAIVAKGGTSKERRPEALFWKGEPVGNFELQLSFRIESGNSGIYYRAKRFSGNEVGGYQFEIFYDKPGVLLETGSDRLRREPSRRGFVTTANVVDNKDKLTVDAPLTPARGLRSNDWNEVVIVAQGNHITHRLNGKTVIETTDEYDQRPRNGLVALEVYGFQPTNVRFRNIRLKRLPPDNSSAHAK